MYDETSVFEAPDRKRVGLEISVEHLDPRSVRVRMAGELDLSTSKELERELDGVFADGPRTSVVLDLRELSFLDSTGLRALWTARQHALSNGGRLVLDEPSDPVLRVLRMTRMDKVFHLRRQGAPLDDDIAAPTP
jgi:anti-sigma B factor antagonist